ncbi:MAG TPA: TraR/DksA family transcriptional regulator [Rectinemataceae bacterium]|nr:TraR/DksA family transcriptional regulator [Rectinemataceae bacterium]
METTFTEQMRELLIAQKREILEALAATNEEFRAIVAEMDPKDVADVASDDIDRKMIEALGSQDIKRLKAIDAALTRISQGRYGLCMSCGKKIPQERLGAIPYAVLCIDCQKSEERRNR